MKKDTKEAMLLKDSRSVFSELRPVVALPITGSEQYKVYDTLTEAASIAKYFEKENHPDKDISDLGYFFGAKMRIINAIIRSPDEYMNHYWIEKYHLDTLLDMGYDQVKMLFTFMQESYGCSAFDILEAFARNLGEREALKERLEEEKKAIKTVVWTTSTDYEDIKKRGTRRIPEIFRIRLGKKLQRTKIDGKKRKKKPLKAS